MSGAWVFTKFFLGGEWEGAQIRGFWEAVFCILTRRQIREMLYIFKNYSMVNLVVSLLSIFQRSKGLNFGVIQTFMSRFFLLAGDRPLALHTLGERLRRYLMKQEGFLSLLCLYTFLKMNMCGSIYRFFILLRIWLSFSVWHHTIPSGSLQLYSKS